MIAGWTRRQDFVCFCKIKYFNRILEKENVVIRFLKNVVIVWSEGLYCLEHRLCVL